MRLDVQEALEKLRLFYLAEHFDVFIRHATEKRLTAMQILEWIAEKETEERRSRSVQARLAQAKIGRFRGMDTFDWSWPESIPREATEALFELNLVEEPSNAILIGPSGLGKTMIAKNIAHRAVLAGHRVLFTEATKMLSDLGSQDSPAALRRRISYYTKPELLVIDEMGYMSYMSSSADLLFQVVNHRHEMSATVITTNKAFRDWGEIFPGAGCVAPMVDRLTEHAEIISIAGTSWRRKQAEERQKKGVSDKTRGRAKKVAASNASSAEAR